MLHNVGKDVVLNENDNITQKWADIYKENGFKTRFDLKYPGAVDVWCNENNIHYMSVEGSSRWGSDWKKQKQAIIKNIKIYDGNSTTRFR